MGIKISQFSLIILYINTFKYHVSCTDGKISVRINLLCQPKPGDRSNFNTHKTVENVAITTKGLQDRTIHMLDGMIVENKGKTIN